MQIVSEGMMPVHKRLKTVVSLRHCKRAEAVFCVVLRCARGSLLGPLTPDKCSLTKSKEFKRKTVIWKVVGRCYLVNLELNTKQLAK